MTALNNFIVRTNSGNSEIPIMAAKPIFILGKNGSGKSELVHRFVSSGVQNVIYMPGARPSYFDNEEPSMTAQHRAQIGQHLQGWNRSAETRYRSIAGAARNEKAIHDLIAAETQYSIDAVREIRNRDTAENAILRLQAGESPLAKVNRLLRQANLPVQIELDRGRLLARRNGSPPYGIARMSDGERTALVFTADVTAATAGTIFVIDEPELHLHRSIVVPLVASLIAERSDCGFIISTHELELPGEIDNAVVILVRGSVWNDGAVASWDIDVLDSTSVLPEEVRVDILGSRRKILFVEGGQGSLDQPIYSLLFPEVSVRNRATCADVRRAVVGLNASDQIHNIRAFGIVDNDAMTPEFIDSLANEQVFALPVFSVESLYYLPECLNAVAIQQAQTLGGGPTELVNVAVAGALMALSNTGTAEHLASKVSERHMRDALLTVLPTREALMNTPNDIQVNIPSPYPGELARLTAMIVGGDFDGIVSRYPIRESGVPAAVARGLRLQAPSDYYKAVLSRLTNDQSLKEAVCNRLAPLSRALLHA
ncbi:hypothetical protein ABI_38710 [Asticcacaulis biprosthecium C19]|uniref:ATPase AAA-type core domain-containing protein n=1 Tax=Asticcacaulis biprosthecium C19 TaxID=715226 RepID=F4QRT7_9CAUL|nr:AAA family ATPase [Asticcacaulis biprosthecium]EGF89457.1 hypothetical protein ABI_38710 [Asticcacaulis biprosthecium C19]